ncbi:bifunctional DNA primase/polymerase [Paludisphaera rhizosphaerae]|uniref:bifunctional DNA primase/polymerase n=1 Tax=Paludisphaera rhizosphaerae TaxID=2711216 RepID=UPI0013EA11A0|nr:bifunctional DNA primase/polymerase [Paludisphaera rhizosphaerae]
MVAEMAAAAAAELPPTPRGRLVEWRSQPRSEYDPVWLYARAARYCERLPRLEETALDLVRAGYQLATTSAFRNDGRKPTRKDWHLDTIRTEEQVVAELVDDPRNLMVVTGPGMAPDGSWLVHLEADADKVDPWGSTRAEALASLARLTAGMGPTPTWESRRGVHLLATVPQEFGETFGPYLAKHELEDFPRVDLIFGGYLRGRRKASSAMIPPSETDGVERVWVDRTLVPAPLPEATLAILARVGRIRVEEAAERAAEARAMRGSVLADLADLDDAEAAEWEAYRLERVLADLEAIGPAIEGSGGHRTTLRAAISIISAGYDGDEAEALLAAYNTDHCDPEWSERELAHKLASARDHVGADKRKEARLWEAWTRSRDRAARYGVPAGVWVQPGPLGGGWCG